MKIDYFTYLTVFIITDFNSNKINVKLQNETSSNVKIFLSNNQFDVDKSILVSKETLLGQFQLRHRG